VCVVDVRVRLRSSVGILEGSTIWEEALDLTVDLCTALFLHLVVNPISNKLPEHGVSLTVDVSGCTCQVINDCLKVMPLPLDAMEAPTPLLATLSFLTL